MSQLGPSKLGTLLIRTDVVVGCAPSQCGAFQWMGAPRGNPSGLHHLNFRLLDQAS